MQGGGGKTYAAVVILTYIFFTIIDHLGIKKITFRLKKVYAFIVRNKEMLV